MKNSEIIVVTPLFLPELRWAFIVAIGMWVVGIPLAVAHFPTTFANEISMHIIGRTLEVLGIILFLAVVRLVMNPIKE